MPVVSLPALHPFICVAVILWLCTGSMGRAQSRAQNPLPGPTIHATHVLGFVGLRHNVAGNLAIEGDAVKFQNDGGLTAKIKLSSIQDIFVEDEDRQVGGTAMMLGKAAVPFGGGRVISLFAHKKYDFLTVEYLDNSGGFHGAIFQLDKGHARSFKKDLIANGACKSCRDDRTTTQSTPEVQHEYK
jgi:hypothetical protein